MLYSIPTHCMPLVAQKAIHFPIVMLLSKRRAPARARPGVPLRTQVLEAAFQPRGRMTWTEVRSDERVVARARVETKIIKAFGPPQMALELPEHFMLHCGEGRESEAPLARVAPHQLSEEVLRKVRQVPA